MKLFKTFRVERFTHSLIIIYLFFVSTSLMAQWNVVTTISNGGFDLATGGNALYLAQGGDVYEYSLSGDLVDSDAYGNIDGISYNSGLYVANEPVLSDVAHDSQGNMIVAYEDFVARFNADGSDPYVYNGLDFVREVAICPVTGNIALADFGTDEVVLLDGTLGFLMAIPLNGVRSVAFDAQGQLFAGGSSPDVVQVYTAGSYVFSSSFDFEGQLDNPESMVFGSNGYLYIASDTETLIASNAALPVILVDFTVRKDGRSHLLSWEAATEINFDFYEIQHSLDAVNFEPVDQIDGRGSNSSYQFSATPKAGDNYYRLKQVDLDGSFEYSKIVSLKHVEEDKLSVYPNPSNGWVTVTQSATIFDEVGRVVARTTAGQTVEILAKGFYTVRSQSGEVQKLIVTE